MQEVGFDELLCDGNGFHTLDQQPFTGIARDYFENGQVRSEMRFVDGYENGRAVEWYANGQLKFEGNYLGSGIHGVSRKWYPDGKAKAESLCEFGIVLSEKEWSETGELLRHYELQPSDAGYEILKKKRNLAAKARQ